MKKRIVLLAIVSFAFTSKTDELTIIKATFGGFEDNSYFFTDENEDDYFFEGIESKAAKKYDLKNKSFVGKKFEVTYKSVPKTNEDDEEYDSFVITDLKLIK